VRDVLLHDFFFQPLDLLLLLFSDLLLDAIKNLLMLGRKLLNSRPLDVGGINITRFRNTGHGSRLIFFIPQQSRQKSVLTLKRAATRALHGHLAEGSLQHLVRSGQTGLVAGQTAFAGEPDEDPTNARPGGISSGQAHLGLPWA